PLGGSPTPDRRGCATAPPRACGPSARLPRALLEPSAARWQSLLPSRIEVAAEQLAVTGRHRGPVGTDAVGTVAGGAGCGGRIRRRRLRRVTFDAQELIRHVVLTRRKRLQAQPIR